MCVCFTKLIEKKKNSANFALFTRAETTKKVLCVHSSVCKVTIVYSRLNKRERERERKNNYRIML